MDRLLGVAILLVLTGVLIASNIYTLIPIYHEVSTDISSSINRTVLGSSIFTLFYAIGLLTFGPLSEIVGRKKVLVNGLLFSAFTTIIVGLASNVSSLYLTRGLQGFALASFAPVAFAYTFELFSAKKRTMVLALINSGFLVAGIVGQLLSIVITTAYSWNYVFFLFGSIYFLLFLISLNVLPATALLHKQDNRIIKDMRKLLTHTELVKCYAITFTLLLSFVAFYDGLGRYFTQEQAIDQDNLLIIRAIGLIGACLSLFTGKIIRRVGEESTLMVGICLALCSLGILLFITTPTSIAILSVFFVAAISLLIPAIISLIAPA